VGPKIQIVRMSRQWSRDDAEILSSAQDDIEESHAE